MSVCVVMDVEWHPNKGTGRAPVPVSILVAKGLKGVELHVGTGVMQFRAIVSGPAWAKDKEIAISSSAWNMPLEVWQQHMLLWDGWP